MRGSGSARLIDIGVQRTFGPKLRHFLAGTLRSRLNALVAEKEAFRDIEIEAVARSTGTRSAT